MSQPVIKVVPLPEGRIFSSNSSSISGLKQSGMYLPNGQYEMSCSSRSNVENDAYHAFNKNKNYWESNYKGNPAYNPLNSSYPDYIQTSYTGNYPSTYRGGGRKENTFITKIGVGNNMNKVKGEWIQIKIPYQIYLKSYNMEVPPSSRSNKFPVEFIVAGSNDGDNWEALHTDNVATDFKGTKKQFELTYPKKFSHFRLIITKMQGEIDKVQIANWSIFGNTIIVPKKNETTESFVTLGRCLDCTHDSKQSVVGGFAPYTEGFDNYTYTSELRQKYPLPESNKQEGFRSLASFQAYVAKMRKQQEERRKVFLERKRKEEEKKRKEEEKKRKEEERKRKEEAEKQAIYNRYIRAVEEKQINPLQKKAAQYEKDVVEITTNHQNISNTLLSITNSEETGLLDEMKKQPSYINSTKGQTVDSVEDTRLKDINQMINTNNEIYVLGGIATATLLVFSGMLWMKQ